MISRLDITDKALEVVEELEQKHGPLMFYQAGGCCEGHNRSVLKKEVFFQE